MENSFFKWKQRYYQQIILGFALWLGIISPVAAGEYTIKTIVGTGSPGCSSTDIRGPRAIVLDKEKHRIYLFETENHVIRYIDQNGSLISYAGTCTQSGYSPDGAFAITAKLNEPVNGKVYKDEFYKDELYFAEPGNHRVRKISSSGKIYTIAGNGQSGFDGDWGEATNAQLISPVAIEIIGNIETVDGKITSDNRQLFIADEDAHCIRVVELRTKIIKTFMGICGTPGKDFINPSNPPNIRLKSPRDIVRWSKNDGFGNIDNLFINDALNNRILLTYRIRRENTDPYFDNTTIITEEVVGFDTDFDATIVVADKKTNRIITESNDGYNLNVVIAGTGKSGYNGDQIDATSAQLSGPHDVKYGWSQEIYVADTGNNRVRVLDPKPMVGRGILLDNSSGRAPFTVELSSNPFDWYGTIEKYQWNASDGQSVEGGEDKQKVKFTFNKAGKYTVTLTVTDDNGGTRTTTSSKITVKGNNSPVINTLTVTPSSGRIPLNVTANVTAEDPDKDPITYTWQYYERNTPSNRIPNSATTNTASFTFQQPGEYCVVAIVEDDRGSVSEKEKCVQVNPNSPPTPLFSVTPTSGEAPLLVTATDQGSSDPDGDPITYEWKYSQLGQTTSFTSNPVTDKKWDFTLNDAGTYCIVLVVRDDQGGETESQPQCVQVDAQKVALVAKGTPTASSCSDFDVTIQVQASGIDIRAVSLVLDFDETLLKVKKIIDVSQHFKNNNPPIFDNTDGLVAFGGNVFGTNPSGNFDLFTIRFNKLKTSLGTNSTKLVFLNVNDTSNPMGTRIKDVQFNDVLGKADDIILNATGSSSFLTGKVRLRSRPNKPLGGNNVRVRIFPLNQYLPTVPIWESREVAIDQSSMFNIPISSGIPSGTYDVYVSKTNTLQKKQTVTINDCTSSSATYDLIAGDVIGANNSMPDNYIDPIDDVALVGKYVMNNPAHLADYNLDGKIDQQDMDKEFLDKHFDLDGNGLLDINDDLYVAKNSFLFCMGDPLPNPSPPNLINNCFLNHLEAWKFFFRHGGKASPRKGTKKNLKQTLEEHFSTVIKLQIGKEQGLVVVETVLEFDPQLLKVETIEAASHLETILGSEFDNDEGLIYFSAAHFGKNNPSGTFPLMTIHGTISSKDTQLIRVLQTRTSSIGELLPEEKESDIPSIKLDTPDEPTLQIKLKDFTATPIAEGILLTWETGMEIDSAGFNILRSENPIGEYLQLNNSFISSQGSNSGANYDFLDQLIDPEKSYYYKLQEVDLNGDVNMYGPISFIVIHHPDNNSFFTPETIPTFAWNGESDEVFTLQYSYEDEQEVHEIATKGTTFRPTVEEWQAFAQQVNGRVISWRVKDAQDNFSETRRLTVTE